MRKSPDEYIDTKAALDQVAQNAEAICERHNKLHPGDRWMVTVSRPGQAAPKLSPELCEALFMQGADVLGAVMDVDSRPSDENARKAAKSWSDASAYLPEFDPKWMALGLAAAATFTAIAPMLAERKGRQLGIVSGRIGPHELEEQVKAAQAAEAARTAGGEV